MLNDQSAGVSEIVILAAFQLTEDTDLRYFPRFE